MKFNHTHPELIVAQSMVPASADLGKMIRSVSFRLASRITPAGNKRAKAVA
ncbi:hypothetical protein [Hwanghaeella grinnelliae]|uniref:hypothetical protein n=1 Tax=Hwanghaeella grinnelliae TaxID=2500179 RepID=UPI00129B9EC9|nr:hypothetical protein [Hwanghaeella grinnelliae]